MRPRVPVSSKDEAQHRTQMAQAINTAMSGHIDASLAVTLTPSAASTTVYDSRLSIQTAAAAHPTTAHAAAEIAAGGMYWVCTKGQMVINHANNAQADRTFMFSFIG